MAFNRDLAYYLYFQIQFYWNTFLSICLHICAMVAELSSCDIDHITHKVGNIYYLAFYKKNFPGLVVNDHTGFFWLSAIT